MRRVSKISYDIKSILLKVIKLTEKRRAVEESKMEVQKRGDSVLESLVSSEAEKELEDFLNSLDFVKL